jgi:predicted naringenin-chalcone synthase
LRPQVVILVLPLVITALTTLLAAQRALKPPGETVAASRRSLSEVGKVSSASVLHILEMISDAGWPPAGSLGLRIGLGPGVSAEACPTEVVTL